MCTFPVQPICTFSCTAHFISLHILLLILFNYLFLISFSPYLYIYSLLFCFIVFIAFMFFLSHYYCYFFYFFCTFNWADLSWLTFHYLLYPVWLCMWQIIKNLEACAGPYGQYCDRCVHQPSRRSALPSHVATRPPSPPLESEASEVASRHWIVDAIALAYQAQGVPCPLRLHAHPTRGVASSWALARGTSLTDICRAAGWETPNTFARFYSLRVEPVSSRVLTSGQGHGEVPA